MDVEMKEMNFKLRIYSLTVYILEIYLVVILFWRATVPIPDIMKNQTCKQGDDWSNPYNKNNFIEYRWCLASSMAFHLFTRHIKYEKTQNFYYLLCSVIFFSAFNIILYNDLECKHPSTSTVVLINEEMPVEFLLVITPLYCGFIFLSLIIFTLILLIYDYIMRQEISRQEISRSLLNKKPIWNLVFQLSKLKKETISTIFNQTSWTTTSTSKS